MSKCVVLVPVGGAIEPECERGLVALEKRGYEVRRRSIHSAIDIGRSVLATSALRDGFDEMMWIDSDIGFDADDVERLRAHDVGFTCAVYPKRGIPELACHVKPGTTELVFGPSGGLTEMLYVGFGFCHVRRHVLDAIAAHSHLPMCNAKSDSPFLPFFQPMVIENDGDHWYLAEDFAFCERARRAGYPVFADTRIRLVHVGRYGYGWEDALGPRERFENVKMIVK